VAEHVKEMRNASRTMIRNFLENYSFFFGRPQRDESITSTQILEDMGCEDRMWKRLARHPF
jgi:hypothetical protein